MARRSSSRPKARASLFSHRHLIAVEAMLCVGLIKDLVSDAVKASTLPNYGKVLFIMLLTLGLFASLFLIVERLTAQSFASTHKLAKTLPWPLPRGVVHLAMLVALFLFYARILHLPLT